MCFAHARPWGGNKDIYIYIPPENSSHTLDDIFGVLYNEIACLPNNCEVMICGDMNARIGSSQGCQLNDYSGSDGHITNLVPVSQSSLTDAISVLKANNCHKRVSKDTKTPNHYGHELLTLCQTTNFH